MTAPPCERPTTSVGAARQFASAYGYTVRRGCWLYSASGRPICEGWDAFTDMLRLLGWVRDGEVRWRAIPPSARDGLRPRP